MGKSKQKPKDYNFMNWLDRKRSNKKQRQEANKVAGDAIRTDVWELITEDWW
jgi:hypothetical protein